MKKKKKNSKLTAAAVPSEKENNVQIDDSGKKSFDFGGLPDRDLKKNLGCG